MKLRYERKALDMKRISLRIVAATLFALSATSAQAENLTPKHGQQLGQIDAVHPKQNTVVIDDRLYHIAGNIRAHGVSGGTPSLQRGYRVEFNAVANSDVNSAGTITEIWIMGKQAGR